jgi:amino acid adenylation domain-containing protein
MRALEVMGYDVSENINSKFDLVFDFVEAGKGILARIEYNTDIYNKETIRRMADHLEQLMSAVVAAPDISIGGLDFLSAEEKDQLLIGFNDTATDYRSDSTIARLFQEQVERSPDAPAIIFGAETFTYREVDRWAGRLGSFLQNKYAIGPDDAVGIKLERSPWLIVAMLAILKAGGACVVVDPGYPAERIDYILGDSGCRTLIDESILARFRADPDPVALAAGTTGLPGQLSFIVYTSGSTGNPKGCMLTNKGVINHLFSKIRLLDLSYGDVICHCSAFHFVGGIWQLLAPLITGGKVVVCTAEELRDIGRLLAIAHSHEARILEIIPSQLNEYLSHEETIRLQSITTLILTGEKLSGHFVRKCYAGNDRVTIFNTYGQTELSDVTTCYRIPKEIIDENILAGRPIQNTAHYILSPSGALCPVGVIGEICTSGDGIAIGYINDEVLTAGKFVDNPFRLGQKMYRTGDLGRWLSGGVLEVAGRKDAQVKIRGFRVELREIEEALLQHPGIEEAAVLNLGKAGGEARLVAFLVGKTRLSASAVRAFLMGKIPAYMMPASFVQLESFPLLENGKTHKKALAQFAGPEMESGVEYIAPKSDVECRLTAIWEDILQRGNIGVRDNFFEMGGHSLKATVMMIRIKHAFDVRLNLRDIFQYATVQKLSEEIEKQLWMQESRSRQQETSDSREIIKI